MEQVMILAYLNVCPDQGYTRDTLPHHMGAHVRPSPVIIRNHPQPPARNHPQCKIVLNSPVVYVYRVLPCITEILQCTKIAHSITNPTCGYIYHFIPLFVLMSCGKVIYDIPNQNQCCQQRYYSVETTLCNFKNSAFFWVFVSVYFLFFTKR